MGRKGSFLILSFLAIGIFTMKANRKEEPASRHVALESDSKSDKRQGTGQKQSVKESAGQSSVFGMDEEEVSSFISDVKGKVGNFRESIDLKGVGDDLGKMLEDTGLGSFVSDIKKAAEDVGITSGDVGVKSLIKSYFKEVREACACMYPQDSDYEYLFKAIYDFDYKIANISYPKEGKAKVKVKVSNVDASQLTENVLDSFENGELADGISQLLKKSPKISTSVIFILEKTDGGWLITNVKNEDEMMDVICGNLGD